MSISPLSGNSAIYNTQFPPVTSSTTSSTSTSSTSGVPGAKSGGKFASALDDALSQLGISTDGSSSSSTASTSGTTSTQDPQQALSAFAQNLFAALQAQASGQSGSSSSSNGSAGSTTADAAAVSGASGGGGHHHHHGGGGGVSKLESGLQNLISQLSSGQDTSTSDSSTSGSTSSDSSATGSTSTSSSPLDALQQSFNNLLAADGASNSGATLSNFLQNLSQNLHGAPSTGNVVSTKV